MPRVSVVMSVYNGAEHLASTVDSISSQTESDFEPFLGWQHTRVAEWIDR